MDNVQVIPGESIGRHFVDPRFVADGEDEFTIRNRQFLHAGREWRQLSQSEQERLVGNGNRSSDWSQVLVCEPFDPALIRNSEFHGLVRIGAVEAVALQHHDMRLPVGITDSHIIASDIGDRTAIHGVRYLAHYIVGDCCILANVDEMHATDHAKFGNGVLKDGESDDVLVKLDVVNEVGSRSICPFDGMLPADAYLWARYRDDRELQSCLETLTSRLVDSRRGYYGTVDEQTVIKNCGIVKDARIGSHCYIKGANKLKNLTINSSEAEPTQIGEGVELVNGIVGFGCRIFYGCKAVRFVLGSNCMLKYGARLIHSFLGDNSTVSCCELLNNLIFPAHEQHHNNSFLVASLVLGQSNVAAGATIGSNHNSRANDSEIVAGRGFWPGLNTSLKHSSCFASYVLISKGSYPAELDIRLPFSLVSNNVSANRLEVMPGFWWLYNMYALARNQWKFQARDGRINKAQNIEFRALAPDTVEEIILARGLLESWTGRAAGSRDSVAAESEFTSIGRRLLTGHPADLEGVIVQCQDVERSRRECRIVKVREGYEAYGQMLHHYAASTLVARLRRTNESYRDMCAALAAPRVVEWENLGGQLVPEDLVDSIRSDIRAGVLSSWVEVHDRYNQLWAGYDDARERHAFAVYSMIHGADEPDEAQWRSFLEGAIYLQQLVRDRVVESRQKDYTNPFRRATYRNEQEMIAALGTLDDNSFVKLVREETASYVQTVEQLLNR